MNIESLNGKSICILGFGKEGQATLRAIEKYASDAIVTIADGNVELQAARCKVQENHLNLEPCTLNLGSNYLQNLEKFDIIIKSPGIPPCPELEAVQEKLTNSTQIFLDTVQSKGCTVIGVTGSKGKSTTSSLIYAVLKEAGLNVDIVGNIGIPALDHLADAIDCEVRSPKSAVSAGRQESRIFVMELSSYQLMDCTVSPHIAIITSFFPDHLDYHGSLSAYLDAKKHCTKFQKASDFVFFDSHTEGAREIAYESPGTKVECTEEDSLVSLEETNLLGQHNLRNIALACKVAQHFDIAESTTIQAMKALKGLNHRLQSLGVFHGIEWVDDAISTTPESTIAGLDALGDRVKILICGGQDRGYDFSELAKRITGSQIDHLILFPESGKRIEELYLQCSELAIPIDMVTSMEEAVRCALELQSRMPNSQSPGPNPQVPICLLSPASPSYNMYKNFEEKGAMFKKYIKGSKICYPEFVEE